MSQNLWVLKSVEDADRALQTVDNYDDKINSVYNYDSKVANFKQIKSGDNIILIDKEKILGFARIEEINEKNGKKIIRKCPECGSSTVYQRKNIIPAFRCNKGHAFAKPDEKEVKVKRFSAHYKNTFRDLNAADVLLNELRPFYIKGYNQNMSMQLLDTEALTIFPEAKLLLGPNNRPPAEDEGIAEQSVDGGYEKNEKDERPIVFRQIKERRGQQKFRSDLFEQYGAVCMITGSRIMDILEAAHINPYRGINDNHVSNGLILRADIHTLFDLNMIGIDPKTLTIHFHKKASEEYKEFDKQKLKDIKDYSPSKSALETRWKIFIGDE
jgi:putative restriction endonuclease